MRIVIYDDESFEAVTVINLPGLTNRDIASRGRRWRLAVPPPPMAMCEISKVAPIHEPFGMEIVELEFEPLARQSARHGRQEHWLCFTRAAELAMKLNPTWLPGQRPAIDELQRQSDRLTEMLLAHIGR